MDGAVSERGRARTTQDLDGEPDRGTGGHEPDRVRLREACDREITAPEDIAGRIRAASVDWQTSGDSRRLAAALRSILELLES